MKIIKRLLATAALILTITALSAQTPPPPNGGDDPGAGGNTPVGGGAPIGSGLGILLLMGAAYGSRKILQNNNEKCDN